MRQVLIALDQLANAQLATAYYQAFNAQLVGRTSAEGATNPRSAA